MYILLFIESTYDSIVVLIIEFNLMKGNSFQVGLV